VRPTIPTFDAEEPFEAWATGRQLPAETRAAWVAPGGFCAFEHLWAAEAAVQFHERLGRARVAARIRELNGTFRRELAGTRNVRLHTPASDGLSAGIVCFEVEGLQPKEVVSRLAAKKIRATTTPYAVSYARVSAGMMVTPEEVARTVSAIRALAG
jgi:selenocysteine lyase/cysteine desulfurase